ncbi:MAG TPA: PaaI family thioesterase [Longimicrobiales bacterium]|nr:PaaI family thioesterase [Longimicrobiales bacterium]
MSDAPAVQDFYPEDAAHCYGCGRLNEKGLRLRTLWDGDETVARFTPEPYHTAIPGYVYGGLIASLVDCHGTGTAAAVGARTAGYRLGEEPVPEGEQAPRYVTASLHVDYLAPTPLGPELTIRGVIEDAGEERGSRKVVTRITVEAEGQVTARGRVVAVRMPESMIR